MTHDDRSLERAARSWLEAGPRQAPDHVVEAALRAIDSTPQERGLRVPRRISTMPIPARLAAAAVVGVLVVGAAAIILRPSSGQIGGPGDTPDPGPSALPTESPTPVAARTDWSDLPGRILVEHLGNAIDMSEMPTSDFNPDTRRFYLMDPANIDGSAAVEFLPGVPATGKSAADVSADGTKVVFQDWAVPTRLYEANLDGTGFRQLPIDCECSLFNPDYDPTATRIVYVRIEGDESWLETYDLETGATAPIEATRAAAANGVPEQPAWSPDGASIVFNRITWAAGHEPVVGTVHYGDAAPVFGVLSVVDVSTGRVTDLVDDPALVPGDAEWAPDGQAIWFADGPFSTTGSVATGHHRGIFRVLVEGGDPELIGPGVSPRFTPDGDHIVFQDDTLLAMTPDGSDALPVDDRGMDLTDLAQGFVYVAHWLPDEAP